MPGVGGRSKGCKTCRKRRVKCDEGKPTCERCRKAGKMCEGYVQFAEFHEVKPQAQGPSKPKSSEKSGEIVFSLETLSETLAASQASGAPLVTDGSFVADDLLIEPYVDPFADPFTEAPVEPFVVDEPFLPLRINPVFDEHTVFTKVIVDNLFDWHDDLNSPHAAGWIQPLLHAREEDNILTYSAFRALAISFFAKFRGEGALIPKGKTFYARALRNLQSQLQDPNMAMDDGVILSITCMGIYEIITFTNPNAWVDHYKGMAKLVALRGPQRHQLGATHLLLPTVRNLITIGHIVQRKRSFLEDEAWKTIPWAIRGLENRQLGERIQDFLVDGPGILEDSDRILYWNPEVPGFEEFKTNFQRRLLAMLEELYAWRWEWEEEYGKAGAVFKVPMDELDPSAFSWFPSSNPFKTVFWFDERYRSTELLNWMTVLMFINRGLEIAGIKMEALPHGDDPLLPMQGDRHDFAVEVCRMATYNLQNCFRSIGAFMLLLPLNVAMFYLDPKRDTGVRPYLANLQAALNSGHGFKVGQLGKEYWPETVWKQKLAARAKPRSYY